MQFIPKTFNKFMSLFLPLILMLSGTTPAKLDYSAHLGDPDYKGLYEVYEDYFPIGAAINPPELGDQRLVDHILKNFNSVTPEWGFGQTSVNPNEGVWTTGDADLIANFARDNGLTMRAHPIMWSVYDTWMAYTDETKTALVDEATLFARMDDFIREMFERYGDIVDDWNIVNEPFNHARSPQIKEDVNWYKIAGDKYITEAFKIAAKYAEPEDKLFLNETFVLNNPAKADNLLENVERWRSEGIRIDGVGLQGHVDTISVNANAQTLKKVLNRCRKMGVEVQITEMDMKIHTSNYQEPYTELPEWIELWQINKYKNFFKVLRDNKDIVTNVTFWGIDDAHSVCSYNYVTDTWREEWPLLFDKNSMPKQNFYAVCDF